MINKNQLQNDNSNLSINEDGITIDYGDGLQLKMTGSGCYITEDDGKHWTNFVDWFFTRE